MLRKLIKIKIKLSMTMKQCSTPVLLNFNSTTDLQQNGYFANQSNNMVDVTLHLMLGLFFSLYLIT